MRKLYIASAISALLLSSLMFATPSRAAECIIAGELSPWGTNSTGTFMLPSGGSCVLNLRIPGVVNSSSVLQKPAHGSLRRVNVSNYEYRAGKGFKGTDTFSVTAVGKTAAGMTGKSVVTLNANIQ